MNIQNNQEENHNNLIEENQNESEDMNNENNQTENHNNLIGENQEPNENGDMNNENNQAGTQNNLITESQTKTNKDEKGTRIDNLVRRTIRVCLIFLCQMIENIAHMGLDTKKLHINKYINENSSEQFKIFFDRKVGDILKEFYQNIIESILNSKDTSEEIAFLKRLLATELFYVIEIYINNKTFSFINSKGGKVELNTFKDVEIKKIQDKSSEIRNKINEILKADGRLRKEYYRIFKNWFI